MRSAAPFLIGLLLAGAVPAGATTYVYPLRVSPNGRYLVDQNGTPFRTQGDAAWSLIANLTYAEADAYLTNRVAKGFNTVNVNLLEHKFAVSAPANRRGVTVVGATASGNLRLYPTGSALPLASAINFVAGKARANNAIVPLGTGGRLEVRCDMPAGSTGSTHFLFDVTGYFK